MANDRDAIQRQIRALSLELARIESQPQDDFDDGAVITWVKTYDARPDHGQRRPHGRFTYAAVKANGRWYMTGKLRGNSYTWNGLFDFIGRDELEAPVIRWCSEWTEL